MTDLLPPSLDDLIRCVERELMLMREVLGTLQRLAKPAGSPPVPRKQDQGTILDQRPDWFIRRAP